MMKILKKKNKNPVSEKNVQINETSVLLQNKRTGSFENGKFILKRPFTSEKATDLNRQNKYVFLVDVSANKPSIEKEIERRYNVAVSSVKIVRRAGKMKRWANKYGRNPEIKKAIITLKPGHKMEIGV
ncbi:MAG: 50S ribosomal protein L23 [Patescibacteria group bacterium]